MAFAACRPGVLAVAVPSVVPSTIKPRIASTTSQLRRFALRSSAKEACVSERISSVPLPNARQTHTSREEESKRGDSHDLTMALVFGSALVGATFAGTPEADAAAQSLWELSVQHSAGLEAAALGLTLVSTAYTLLFSGRFLLSCFPQLERKRKEMPWAVLTSSTDPFLEPLRPVFAQNKQRLEGMDVAAVVGLTLLSIFQEILFGADGIMLSAVPYAMAQNYLELLLLLQRGFCLPIWLLLVFRILNYI